MALNNEEELFTEASGELQTEVEESLESARESLPARELLVAEEQTALHEVVAGLPAELDPIRAGRSTADGPEALRAGSPPSPSTTIINGRIKRSTTARRLKR
jgi:hypothetical protein